MFLWFFALVTVEQRTLSIDLRTSGEEWDYGKAGLLLSKSNQYSSSCIFKFTFLSNSPVRKATNGVQHVDLGLRV